MRKTVWRTRTSQISDMQCDLTKKDIEKIYLSFSVAMLYKNFLATT